MLLASLTSKLFLTLSFGFRYMTVGCNALRLILRNFAPVIKTNVQAPPGGVDISREERYNKCVKCYQSMMTVRAFLLKRQTLQGKLGHAFREMLILMESHLD
uniref:Katanin p80 subunit C-terminal domain-containing protein n=1 Tax=Timema monikensis TaxID=170555 RepID=A0A7R9HUZ6_9NEOP|nr:unnamed protein product [Timema monikensis]